MLNNLELKVMPVWVFIINVILMALVTWLLPHAAFDFTYRIIIGILFILLGISAFKKANTPKSPIYLDKTVTLVTNGIYQYTRNPMYLGGVLAAIGMAFLFGNGYAFFFVLGFMAYINRFQIKPEEQVLATKFPKEFIQYQKYVRRWL